MACQDDERKYDVRPNAMAFAHSLDFACRLEQNRRTAVSSCLFAVTEFEGRSMFSSRERVLATLRHEEPDRVPIDLGFPRV